jgi:hypothetical protein
LTKEKKKKGVRTKLLLEVPIWAKIGKIGICQELGILFFPSTENLYILGEKMIK